MEADAEELIRERMAALIEDHDQLLRRLVALRRVHRLTQTEVAERMGVSQATVSEMERYDANPTLSTVRRYALAVEARTVTAVIDDGPNSRWRWVTAGAPVSSSARVSWRARADDPETILPWPSAETRLPAAIEK